MVETVRFPVALTDDVPRMKISGAAPPTIETTLMVFPAALALSELSTIELIFTSLPDSTAAPPMSVFAEALLVMTAPVTPASAPSRS